MARRSLVARSPWRDVHWSPPHRRRRARLAAAGSLVCFSRRPAGGWTISSGLAFPLARREPRVLVSALGASVEAPARLCQGAMVPRHDSRVVVARTCLDTTPGRPGKARSRHEARPGSTNFFSSNTFFSSGARRTLVVPGHQVALAWRQGAEPDFGCGARRSGLSDIWPRRTVATAGRRGAVARAGWGSWGRPKKKVSRPGTPGGDAPWRGALAAWSRRVCVLRRWCAVVRRGGGLARARVRLTQGCEWGKMFYSFSPAGWLAFTR